LAAWTAPLSVFVASYEKSVFLLHRLLERIFAGTVNADQADG